jgi:exosome complex component RRP4
LVQDIDDATWTAITRVSNIIRVFAAYFVPLTDSLLVEAYEWSLEHVGEGKDVLQEDIGEALVSAVTAAI